MSLVAALPRLSDLHLNLCLEVGVVDCSATHTVSLLRVVASACQAVHRPMEIQAVYFELNEFKEEAAAFLVEAAAISMEYATVGVHVVPLGRKL